MVVTRHGPRPRPKPQPSNPINPMSFRGIPTRKLSDFPNLRGLKPTLSWIKLHHPTKGYKLVWEFLGKVVYCGENQITYKSRGRVVEAGEQLGNLLGVRFKP